MWGFGRSGVLCIANKPSCQICFVNEVFFWRQCVYNCHPKHTPHNTHLLWQPRAATWSFPSFQIKNYNCSEKLKRCVWGGHFKMWFILNGLFNQTPSLSSALVWAFKLHSSHVIGPASMMLYLLRARHTV